MSQLDASWIFSPKIPQASATDEQLDAVETQLGYPLPADYREFLRDYGGYSVIAACPVQEDEGPNDEGVSIFFGGHPDRMDLVGMYQNTVETYEQDYLATFYPGLRLIRSDVDAEETRWPPELLPITDDGGGGRMCIALFGLRPHAIFFWSGSAYDDKQNLYLVATTFDEFMHLLRNDA